MGLEMPRISIYPIKISSMAADAAMMMAMLMTGDKSLSMSPTSTTLRVDHPRSANRCS